VSAATATRRQAGSRTRRASTAVSTGAIFVVGCGALAARFAIADATARPTTTLVLLLCALLALGASLPLPYRAPAPAARMSTTTAVAVAGIAAFVAGRVLVGGHAPIAVSRYAVFTSVLAAVAEEAWFRRLGFGLLEPAGPVVAIGGSTLLFAMVHVATYGWWVLPIDLAAGALLGWQRSASGSWAAPAITHVIANLVVLL
jgi:hypothetical protein